MIANCPSAQLRRALAPWLGALALVGAFASAPTAYAASKASHVKAAPVDLSGFWELRADSKHVPRAELTEAFKAGPKDGGGQKQYNNLVIFASRWCHPLGVPFIMGDSAPLDIVQSKREIAITAEVQSSARHIYIDGRPHVDPAIFDETTNGHSIGHWEGRTLVVDTVGFNIQGNRSIPGGGLRGQTSHLVERYQLRNGGKELNVQFTWTDPAVFAEPHTYDFTYYRDPPNEFAREYFCDASDKQRGESVHPTE